ncbi:MAG TPA: sulfotransferase [Acetobacteraceae bacterium]|nr:sulfotransferase [Acetobacteraceae bacterium]
MRSWIQHQADIATLARCQLFFIGGAPRSGTTWVQQILDRHPEIACRGEGLFQKHLSEPLAALFDNRSEALAAKNTALFGHTGGFPLPTQEDQEVLLGTAILLALRQCSAGKACRAIGEKTPENVFFFPRLKRLFPRAKCIAVARDPRDVLTSAWHFFHRPAAGEDDIAAKFAFIRLALPSLDQGARAMIDLAAQYPADVMTITYERLRRTPELVAANMFRFLSVSDAPAVTADCVAGTAFAAQTGGRSEGVAQDGAFLRKGIAGDWPSTLTPAMNELILSELGWMFPHFGWSM